MKKTFFQENRKWLCVLTIIMMLQLFAASYFCIQKQGFHYDEYYSYYSSNVTYGLVPTDREWKDTAEIISEFQVLEGRGFQYGLVKTMQSFDVHPPLYYMLLHTVCSFFPGKFSKWFGLGINLALFVVAFWLIAYLSYHIFRKNKNAVICVCLLFGFQPGVISGITFIRMYMLLTVWCLLITIWHLPFWEKKESLRNLSVKRRASLLLLVLLGFLTHYYFAVFLFFLAAYTCLYNWWIEKDLKGSIGYGINVCLGMILAVLWYPASAKHIFRGYRGEEAMGAFFDVKNTWERIRFFFGLMNESVFGGSLYVILGIVLFCFLVTFYRKKRNSDSKVNAISNRKLNTILDKNQGFVALLFVTTGYFLVVAKTALMNAQEANRYELPIYGFCMMIVIWLMYGILVENIHQNEPVNEVENLHRNVPKQEVEDKKQSVKNMVLWEKAVFILCVGILLGSQFICLNTEKVQFLYPEDRANVDWAKEHDKEAVLYLYSPQNTWMIWDEAEELMQYEQIYFVNMADTSPITDERMLREKEILVYTSRRQEAEEMMGELIKNNPNLQKKEKIRELLYCDLYQLK